MSVADYAAMQREFGTPVVERKGCYWRRVRPFFYRPLLPMEPLSGPAVDGAFFWPAGYQYVASPGEEANSSMGFIILENLRDYSLDTLGHRRRNLIGNALRTFQVRPITSPDEIKRQGHGVYLSFFQRTGYTYKSERQQKGVFDDWVDTLFRRGKALVLGGYGPTGLVAVSTSFWVKTTLIYSTLFCESAALKKNLGEAMFHELRRLAALEPGLERVHVRNYQGGRTLDEYYLLRGAKLVHLPSRLVLPPGARGLLRTFAPRHYTALSGGE